MSEQNFLPFEPCQHGLLEWLMSRATDRTLSWIADADCGIEYEANYATLYEIRKSFRVPDRLEFPLTECLCLCRWNQPEDLDGHPRDWNSEEYHTARAIANVIYLDAITREGTDVNYDDPSSLIVPLLESGLVLGTQPAILLGRFLCWHVNHDPSIRWATAVHHYRALAVVQAFLLRESCETVRRIVTTEADKPDPEDLRPTSIGTMDQRWAILRRTWLDELPANDTLRID